MMFLNPMYSYEWPIKYEPIFVPSSKVVLEHPWTEERAEVYSRYRGELIKATISSPDGTVKIQCQLVLTGVFKIREQPIVKAFARIVSGGGGDYIEEVRDAVRGDGRENS